MPEPEKLAEWITFGFAEVESVEKKGGTSTSLSAGETVFDVKVLPDRACYTLSHRGVAYEVSAILGIPKKTVEYPEPEVEKVRPLEVRVEAPDLCSRYMARVVLNVTAKEQAWATEHLESVGQRSINPIVDGANLVMFDRGQPLHAFDADKVQGALVVRRAKKGEQITTLDNREVSLDESVLLIADDEGPLGIAGIKGGTRAAVTSETKNLILESASFDASYIRKASERFGIKTDASKRFENKFSASLADKGMSDFSAYLFEMDKRASFGEIIDWYPEKLEVRKFKVGKEEINRKLGIDIPEKEIEDIFSRLLFKFEKEKDGWSVSPPLFRADLTIPADIAEEVGRIFGYDKIPLVLPPKTKKAVEIPKSFYYEWKIREILINAGFSEVMTSSFLPLGDIEIEKPLAEDKRFARNELWYNFHNSLQTNHRNSSLFGTGEIKQFEIGKVFTKNGEFTSLIIGYFPSKKAKKDEVEKYLTRTFGHSKFALGMAPLTDLQEKLSNKTLEANLSILFEKLPEPSEWDISIPTERNKKFTPFSPYPFIVRDVALFVSPDTISESVGKVIRENAGELVVRGPELFDEFSKEGKKSLAFRLVFQSSDRTLSDEEVNKAMEKVYVALKEKGGEVR